MLQSQVLPMEKERNGKSWDGDLGMKLNNLPKGNWKGSTAYSKPKGSLRIEATRCFFWKWCFHLQHVVKSTNPVVYISHCVLAQLSITRAACCRFTVCKLIIYCRKPTILAHISVICPSGTNYTVFILIIFHPYYQTNMAQNLKMVAMLTCVRDRQSESPPLILN